ncbi:MAG: hypothetical protein GQ558_03915 [Thermoplasmata archaeon]|jgi:hypothetical protein|nr:hypothetical protein [Thermoplasmata archaeon]
MTRKGDDGNGKVGPTDIPPCNYELRSDGNSLTMRVLCRECGQRELRDRNCFSSLLRAFANEVNVDRITLSNHVETQYFGKALSILKGITALSYEMRQLSLRTPATPSGKTPKRCSDCQFYPRKVFTKLNEQFLRDVGLFYSLFHDMTVRLYEEEAPDYTCGECLLATREDFDYTYSRFETLLREIVKEGYAVVV